MGLKVKPLPSFLNRSSTLATLKGSLATRKQSEDVLMVVYIALFLVGLSGGFKSVRLGFLFTSLVLLVTLLGMSIIWQNGHQWPGLFDPEFAETFAGWVLTLCCGLVVGGLSGEYQRRRRA
jgi:hypothetical protein